MFRSQKILKTNESDDTNEQQNKARVRSEVKNLGEQVVVKVCGPRVLVFLFCVFFCSPITFSSSFVYGDISSFSGPTLEGQIQTIVYQLRLEGGPAISSISTVSNSTDLNWSWLVSCSPPARGTLCARPGPWLECGPRVFSLSVLRTDFFLFPILAFTCNHNFSWADTWLKRLALASCLLRFCEQK